MRLQKVNLGGRDRLSTLDSHIIRVVILISVTDVLTLIMCFIDLLIVVRVSMTVVLQSLVNMCKHLVLIDDSLFGERL
jgi:hypothetical protein